MRSKNSIRTALVVMLMLGVTAAFGQGVLRVAVPFPITSLDTQGTLGLDIGTTTAAKHIFDTLVTREGNEFRPAVAASWSNPDANTWIFQLRDDVTFHDGTQLTAADVKASMERYVELNGPAAALFSPITVETNGDYEVVMTTEEPMGTVLVNLTRMFVGPSEYITDPQYGSAPVGSGPYRLEQFVVDDRVVLVRNENYWGERPSLDRIELLRIPEVSSRLTALETGEVDLTWLVPADQLPRLEASDELVVEAVPSYAAYVIWFNSSREPFTDVRVRRALWHAVDYESIIQNLYQGVGVAASAPVTSEVFGHVPQPLYEYNPELARQLLAEAGYPDGFQTSIQWRNEEYSDITYTIISDLADVGVTVEPLQKEHAIWLEDLVGLNFDMNLMTQSAATGDADISLGRLYQCAAKRTGYCSDELDELLLAARAELDQERRLGLYDQVSQIIWGEALGMYPIDVLETYVYRTNVHGFVADPSGAPDFTSVTLEN